MKFDEHDFQTQIQKVLGLVDPAATQNWLNYARELEVDGTESSAIFFREVCGELELIKHEYGRDIALQIYNGGREFTFNPFEMWEAAKHLKAGKAFKEVEELSREGDFFTLPRKYYRPEITVTLPYEERWYEALRTERGEEMIRRYLTATLDRMTFDLLPEGLFNKVAQEMETERQFQSRVNGTPANVAEQPMKPDKQPLKKKGGHNHER